MAGKPGGGLHIASRRRPYQHPALHWYLCFIPPDCVAGILSCRHIDAGHRRSSAFFLCGSFRQAPALGGVVSNDRGPAFSVDRLRKMMAFLSRALLTSCPTIYVVPYDRWKLKHNDS